MPGRSTQALRPGYPLMTEELVGKEALLVRIGRGEPEAVRACLARYGPLVWSVARRAGCDPARIEDLVQEIFIELWRKAGRYDPERASEATFITTIARRRVIDDNRRRGRMPVQQDLEDQELPREDESLVLVDEGDEARLARQALAELKPDQRRVILMSVVEGLTHREIAAATGIPLGTVKSHIRRGLDQAAQKLRAGRGGDS